MNRSRVTRYVVVGSPPPRRCHCVTYESREFRRMRSVRTMRCAVDHGEPPRRDDIHEMRGGAHSHGIGSRASRHDDRRRDLRTLERWARSQGHEFRDEGRALRSPLLPGRGGQRLPGRRADDPRHESIDGLDRTVILDPSPLRVRCRPPRHPRQRRFVDETGRDQIWTSRCRGQGDRAPEAVPDHRQCPIAVAPRDECDQIVDMAIERRGGTIGRAAVTATVVHGPREIRK